jgi:hypothetical protein
MVAHNCTHSYLGDESRRILSRRLAGEKLGRPYLKNKIQYIRTAGVAQVVEHLASVLLEDLGSVPGTYFLLNTNQVI